MPQWEYREISLNDTALGNADADALSKAGAEGWELIAITINHVAYLKRPIDAPADAPATPALPKRTIRRRKTTPSAE